MSQVETLNTAEKVAKRHGVSRATVMRAAKFAEEMDNLPPEERAAILAGREKEKRSMVKQGL